MADVVSVLTGVISTAKKLREVSGKIKDADMKNLIADLNLALANLKLKIADLQKENILLREELEETRKGINIRDTLELRNGLYYLKESMEGRPDGPYCTRCFDADNKLILVAELPKLFRDLAKFECSNCKTYYGGTGI